MNENRNNGGYNRHENFRDNVRPEIIEEEIRIDVKEGGVKGLFKSLWKAMKENKKVVIVIGALVLTGIAVKVFWKKIKALFMKGKVTAEEIAKAAEEAAEEAACDAKK